MSDSNLARRTSLKVYFANVDISDEITKYLISLSYTDKEEDEADDLQIQIADKSSVWLTKWLNDTLAAVKDSPVPTSPEYKIIAQTGLAVRSGQGDTYNQYGTLPYGEIVNVLEISNGWARIRYSGKDAYVNAEYLQMSESSMYDVAEESTKGMKIQATIVRQNWNNNGKDDMLECGEFELDSISASGRRHRLLSRVLRCRLRAQYGKL